MDFSNFTENGKKILAAWRNFQSSAAPLGDPVFFQKPVSAYITEGAKIKFPFGCEVLNHEVELAVLIGKKITQTIDANVFDYVAGYVLALDMTAVDFQNRAKTHGLPWLIGKGFDTSCPVSRWIPSANVSDPRNLVIWCTVNGTATQRAKISDMTFSIPQLIEHITKYVRLEPCDLILTGTPPGSGPVKHGDVIECGMEENGCELVKMSFEVE